MQTMNKEPHQDLSLSHKSKCTFSKAIAAVVAIAAFSTIAYADDKAAEPSPAQVRVIEDSLVYSDPTVARENNWTMGFSVDYYSLSQNLTKTKTLYSSLGQPETGNLSGMQVRTEPGVSLFVGYGDVTAMLSYRSGTGSTSLSGSLSPDPITVNEVASWTSSETELDVRWLLRKYQISNFVPYILAGYISDTETDNYNGSCTWAGSSCIYAPSSLNGTITAPLIGIGGIIPLTEKYGIRVDERFANASANYTIGSFSGSTNFNMNRLTATMYYNFADSWNAQLGGRYQTNNSAGGGTTAGLYAMLGYTIK